ncbi:uncharacterized protein LOC117791023 [Drosophila innubila]|uniref:uncharacterized protein LOC117791023 n=1 Tax=Drosophila innubila TaxID=198719 RepID=UPI00148E8652|nr:uncharacterized protein LOC117791023 [Drosophila innubila]
MSKPVLRVLSQISGDASGPPTWLDQQELQRLITENSPKFQSIVGISTRSEQFPKSALRMQIQVKLAENTIQTMNFLVKSKEQTNYDTLKFPRPHSFELEMHMYNEVLPALEELYKNVGKSINFSPHSHKPKLVHPAKDSKCLYLDYLQDKGYKLANQPKGLSKSAMEAILSKLAAYHAATARYLQLNPNQLRELSNRSSRKESDHKIAELKNFLQRKFSESLRSNGLQDYEDKVKCYLKNLADCEKTDIKRSFNVISIGACWPNNLLGHFDAFGNVKDAIFIDFGSVSHGPAIYDLFQLLLTAPAEKTEHFDAHLRYYQDELNANLNLLNFKGSLPTLTDLQVELLDFGHWGVEVVMEILPLVLADFESSDVDDIFKTRKYSEEIKKLLPWLENRAYFEVEPEPINYY